MLWGMSSFGLAVETYEKQLRDWLSKCPVCLLSPQVMLHARKGMAMIQVGQSFEFDERLHARDNPPNHLLARQLIQYNGKIKNPIIFGSILRSPRTRSTSYTNNPLYTMFCALDQAILSRAS